jgi:ubiquinone/menaquinone biosynthesis C-methylase UbiE
MDKYEVEKKKWDEKSEHILATQHDWKRNQTYDTVFQRKHKLMPVYRFFDRIGEPGIQVLDYGAGAGWTALLFSSKAESVQAFDISTKRIHVLNRYIEQNHLQNLKTIVANGEELPYADETFDYIFGHAILHHLTLDTCLPEITRILKPGGRAAFCEPMAHNPLVNAYRFVKHHYVEKYLGTDHPFRLEEKITFEKYFSNVEFVKGVFFREKNKVLFYLNDVLLRVPLLSRYASYMTILLEKENENGH